jgi:uncharacterized protein (TIGR02246 family)
MKVRLSLAATLAVTLAVAVPAIAGTRGNDSNAKGHSHGGGEQAIAKLVDAHLAALAACDADALVAGYTNDATLFFPDGVVVQGRAALQSLYDGFVKSHDQGGLCGLTATPVQTWTSGKTTFVKFSVTAPFLAKTYFSTDGYVFKHGKIAAEMSTFDASKLVFN